MKVNIEYTASKKGYIVSEEGIMYNPKGKEIGKTINNQGYKFATLRTKDKNSVLLLVHRLQAYQKYGDKLYEEGIMVRHKDGIKTNNSWGNILIGTNSDNQMDIPEQIRIKRALTATSHVRKYNKDEVKAFHKIENSYEKTMEKFNISSKGTLHYILNSKIQV